MKPFLAPDRNNLSVAEVNEAWGERTKEINNKLVANLRNLYEKIGSTHRNIFIWDAIVALQMSHALEDAYQAERDSLHADLAAAMECLREVAKYVGEVPTKKAQTKDFPYAEVDWTIVAKIHAFLGRTK